MNNSVNDLLNQAITCKNQGLVDKAFSLCEQLLELEPKHYKIIHFKGTLEYDLGNYDSAIEYFSQAIPLSPFRNALLHNHLGLALFQKGDTKQAQHHLFQAIDINPKLIEPYFNLARICEYHNDLPQTIEIYKKALTIDPRNAETYDRIGISMQLLGDYQNAINAYTAAITLDPNKFQSHFHLALVWLLQGNFEAGWDKYEYRLKIPPLRNWWHNNILNIPKPIWQGEDLNNKNILVYTEQGFGDNIQFCRYLNVVHDMGARVFFLSRPALTSLFRNSNIKAAIFDNEKELNSIQYDYHIPLLSIPHRLKTNFTNIPAPLGYLKADDTKIAEYHQKFFNNDKFKIALFWQGTQTNIHNKNRSVPLEKFYPLLCNDDIQCYSIQKDGGHEQIKKLPPGHSLIDLTPTFHTFNDTAAALANVDLVISIDTAVNHLAGAIGVPVWALVLYSPEWRWFLDREDSPWYPKTKLFRQSKFNDWDSVVHRLEKELLSLVRSLKIDKVNLSLRKE